MIEEAFAQVAPLQGFELIHEYTPLGWVGRNESSIGIPPKSTHNYLVSRVNRSPSFVLGAELSKSIVFAYYGILLEPRFHV